MGMYDSFFLNGKWADLVVCPAGHSMVYEVQTKDLEQTLAVVHVAEDGSTCASQYPGANTDYNNLTCTVEVGGDCGACAPYYLTTNTGHYNLIYPTVGFKLTFEAGVLLDLTEVNWQTRDEWYALIKAAGSSVTMYKERPADCERQHVPRWPD
jgi:hypothetical protein